MKTLLITLLCGSFFSYTISPWLFAACAYLAGMVIVIALVRGGTRQCQKNGYRQ